ncbi:MAG TPA: hypothetical protein ENK57_02135 [Polyangiaceae bacterium]|nr:hypothetical protein [Polyangiaceae bacterium]
MPRLAHLLLRVLIALLIALAATPDAWATALSFGTELASPPTARSAKREDGLGGDGGAKRRRGGASDNFEGELLEVENEEGEVHHLDRDINGLLIAERTFDDRHLKYTNDLLGRTVLVQNGAGELTELQYDAASQLIARTLDDGSAETFTYNLRGELIKATNSTGEFEFERDAVGRIVREAQTVAGTTHWVEVDYDAEGDRLGRRTSLGHTEAVQRDALGARTRTLLDGQHQLTHTNDALGREVARFLPGGGRIETGYDALGRVAARRAMDNTVPLPAPGTMPDWQTPLTRGVTVDTRYRYSPDGELVESWDKDRGKTEYRYDPIGQLLAMVPDQGKAELFRFDPRGNIYEADPGAPPRVYGKGNRLLRKGDTLYTWDDDGRLVEKRITYPGEDDGEGGPKPDEVWRYRWNAAGLLSQVTRPDGAKVRFVYDPFARRMGKGVVPGKRSELTASNTRFVWDGDVLAHEIRVSGRDSGDPVVEERTYLFEDESFEPAAHEEGGEWVHYVNDQVGTPRQLVRSTGESGTLATRKAWGQLSSSGPGDHTPLRHPGQHADIETGLFYNRWRHYDPDSARFSSPDPLGATFSPNLYEYAPNPFLWIDPSGLITGAAPS